MLGNETYDPYYFECGPFWDVNRCRYSDAVTVTYHPGVAHDFGRISRTLVRAYGPNHDPDAPPDVSWRTIDDADPYITITGKGSWPIDGSTVDKIGRTSGWTYGTADRTCQEVEIGDDVRLCGGRAHYRRWPASEHGDVYLCSLGRSCVRRLVPIPADPRVGVQSGG